MVVNAIPYIVKAAKIALHLLPIAYMAEPYVAETIHTQQGEKTSCKGTRKISR